MVKPILQKCPLDFAPFEKTELESNSERDINKKSHTISDYFFSCDNGKTWWKFAGRLDLKAWLGQELVIIILHDGNFHVSQNVKPLLSDVISLCSKDIWQAEQTCHLGFLIFLKNESQTRF